MLHRFILTLSLVLGVVFSGYARHTDEEYYQNPELALSDAWWNVSQGLTDRAILLLNMYHERTGKDTSFAIAKVKMTELPSWVDPSTMKVVFSNNRIIFVYDKLMSASIWGTPNIEVVSVPGVAGQWETCAPKSVYVALKKAEFPMPSEGLFGGRSGGDTAMKWDAETRNGVVEWEDVKTSYTAHLWTGNGQEEAIDCGFYSKTGNPTRQGTVEFEVDDHMKQLQVWFYPFRAFELQSGEWKEIRLKRVVNSNI